MAYIVSKASHKLYIFSLAHWVCWGESCLNWQAAYLMSQLINADLPVVSRPRKNSARSLYFQTRNINASAAVYCFRRHSFLHLKALVLLQVSIFSHIKTCDSRCSVQMTFVRRSSVIKRLSWWRYQMETFSALLAICAGNSPVPGEFPAQRPVTRSFDDFFDLHPNKRLSKQWRGWWFETPSNLLWYHCNGKATIRMRDHLLLDEYMLIYSSPNARHAFISAFDHSVYMHYIQILKFVRAYK